MFGEGGLILQKAGGAATMGLKTALKAGEKIKPPGLKTGRRGGKRQRGKGRCDEGGKAAAEEMRETVSGLAGKGDFTRPLDGQREENAKTGGQNAGGDERNGEKNGREHFP